MCNVKVDYPLAPCPIIKIKVMSASNEPARAMAEIRLSAKVDTGAERTVIRKEVAKNLLMPGAPKLVSTVTGERWFDTYSCRISILGLNEVHYKVIMTPPYEVYEKLEKLPEDIKSDDLPKYNMRYDAGSRVLYCEGVMAIDKKNELLGLSQGPSGEYEKVVEKLFQKASDLKDEAILGMDFLNECFFMLDGQVRSLAITHSLPFSAGLASSNPTYCVPDHFPQNCPFALHNCARVQPK